jgi:A/G-specific adenine glycosylase
MAAARIVAEYHGGEVPSDYDALISLPGVGRYMAGAVLSIAFNKPYPVVDGNVRRVLSRVYGWTEEDSKALWEAADRLVRAGEPRTMNQAIMELGAKVCSFRSPRCLLCPLQASCIALRTGRQESIPPAKKRPATIHVHVFAVVHQRGERYLMKQVDGMWEFPMFPELPRGAFEKVGACRHTITHHRLDVSVCTGEVSDPQCEWKGVRELPMSSLTRKVLRIFCRRGL